MKIKRPKGITKTVREFYGMSQKELADLLEISRSHLSMMDTTDRDISNLPQTDYDFLIRLQMAINLGIGKKAVKDVELTKSINNQKENLKIVAQKRMERLKYKSDIAEDALTAIKAEQERSSNAIGVIPFLREKANVKFEAFIKVLEIDSMIVQGETGVDAQLKLESQLIGLKAEMDFLEQLIKD